MANDTSNPPTSPVSLKVTVPTAGTPIAAASASTLIRSVTFKGISTNVGIIYVGALGLSNTAVDGFPLLATDTYSMEIRDLAKVGLNATVNGEGVHIGTVL